MAEKIPTTQYAAAVITFLDRATGNETAYCYPITKIVLVTSDAKAQETWRVTDGKWVRAS